jgi:site-specific recombinase XerD
MKSLASQALETVGKQWKGASITREAKLQAIKRFANYVEKTFGLQDIKNLKPGHIESYAKSIHGQVSPRTGANYMAYVRDVCQTIGKPGICARDNAFYGFGGVPRQNPQELNTEKVSEIRATLGVRAAAGDHLAMMMSAAADMREQFGLRHKEALMSNKIEMRDGKPHLVVEQAKCGRPRVCEIKTAEQREALAKVAETAGLLENGNGRIIPTNMSLKSALIKESKEWNKLGGTKAEKASMHLARHNYAQKRLAEGATKAEVNRDLGHGDKRSLGSYSK